MAQAGEYIWRCMQISVRIVCELCCSWMSREKPGGRREIASAGFRTTIKRVTEAMIRFGPRKAFWLSAGALRMPMLWFLVASLTQQEPWNSARPYTWVQGECEASHWQWISKLMLPFLTKFTFCIPQRTSNFRSMTLFIFGPRRCWLGNYFPCNLGSCVVALLTNAALAWASSWILTGQFGCGGSLFAHWWFKFGYTRFVRDV